jgi:hypothetical protein
VTTEAKSENERHRETMKLFTPPFRFEGGYTWDAKGEMVADNHTDADSIENPVLRVRGWGRLSYLPNTEQLYNDIGALLADALTAYWNRK